MSVARPAVRERIRPALAIVPDESPDGHGLLRIVDDADRAAVNAGRDTEQNHAVLCAEFCRRLFHGLFPPPAPSECRDAASRRIWTPLRPAGGEYDGPNQRSKRRRHVVMVCHRAIPVASSSRMPLMCRLMHLHLRSMHLRSMRLRCYGPDFISAATLGEPGGTIT